MTNGEKIVNTFHGKVSKNDGVVYFSTDGWIHAYADEWWNAECEEPNHIADVSEMVEPTTKNDLGVDCISRADAITAMQNKAKKLKNEDTINGLCGAVAILFDLPSVTPQEPRKGHWITKNGKEQGYDIGGVKTWYIQIMCSECGFIKTAIEGHTGQYHFCPNCGAKMDRAESEET